MKFKLIKVSEKAHEELQRLSDKRKQNSEPIRSQIDIVSELIIKAAKKELK
jgi:hypothetical protein